MSLHTKPPWKFIKGRGYGYSMLVGAGDIEILTTGGYNDGDSPITWMGEELTEADKLLIEAAPNLLAACEEALTFVLIATTEHANANKQGRENARACADHIKAVLAEATGGES